jgi:hypothetical protein
VTLEQVAERGVLDELSAATGAIVQSAGAAFEQRHLDAADGAIERTAVCDGLEPEVAPASGTMNGV